MDKNNLRIIFMGTPEFAEFTLKTLVENNYNIVGVVTQPDKPVGRHRSVLQQSPVKQYAISQNIPVFQPEKMKNEQFLQDIKQLNADIFVVVAFRMLPIEVWSMPKYGTFNIHTSLLPHYRGAAPINWVVINGETKTGITSFFLDKDIDTGRIIEQNEIEIPHNANAEYVHDELMKLGATTAISTINKIITTNGKVETISQESLCKENEPLKLAPKIFKETCKINFNQNIEKVYNFVRGLSPYPGAWCEFISKNDSSKIMVLKLFQTTETTKNCDVEPGTIMLENNRIYVATTNYWLEINELQVSGKKRISSKEFLNGFRDIELYCLK